MTKARESVPHFYYTSSPNTFNVHTLHTILTSPQTSAQTPGRRAQDHYRLLAQWTVNDRQLILAPFQHYAKPYSRSQVPESARFAVIDIAHRLTFQIHRHV